MIQLINSIPFSTDPESLSSLRKDWTRFKDGLVILSEIPDAIRGEYECEAEILEQEDSEGETENETEGIENLKIQNIPSGKGNLILTASKLYWIIDYSSLKLSTGWSVDYKNVLLHAISKPDASRPSIYLQLSCNKIIDLEGNEIDFKDSNCEDDEKFVEVNLFVKDIEMADEIFVALSECSSLHPCEDEFEDEFEFKRNKINSERYEDATEN